MEDGTHEIKILKQVQSLIQVIDPEDLGVHAGSLSRSAKRLRVQETK